MFNQSSKEVEVQKISISIFITNFPDSFNAKDLWRVCNQYGTVVHTFIPDKRSKANKRYGFVRFIKADNVEHLVSNLCTIWGGKLRLHANIARFQRKPLNRNSSQTYKIQTNKHGQKDVSIMKAANGFAGSFAHAVKKRTKSHYEEVESQRALVLDESCLNQSDMSTALMGKVKTFDSLSNLKPVLAKEGFDEITLKYMGGFWVLIDFQTITTKEKFMANTSVVPGKVFLVHAKEEFGWTSDFVEEEENESEYDEMVSNEGDHEENGNNTNSVVNDSDIDEKHPQSEDLFNLYDLLNKKNNKSNGGSSSNSNLKYPPGFTPSVADEDKREDLYVSGDENEIRSKYVQVEVISPCEKEKEQNRYNGWHNDIHKPVYSGGSILQVMEDMVKVGKTMGYNTKGCVNNIEEIIKSQGVNDGKWIPNGRMILIISIYAPQELREKKMLWDYLTMVIGNWQGDVLIMGDFNEVRKQEERYGSVFNIHGADPFNMFISNAGLEEIHLGGCSFTWCHKSASKMSKLDRFLVSEGIMSACPNISALMLDR
ncbi:RNA-directed DNA polymerase, eukaryota, reverse transcriptase zinc-binding domain protein [Tanacetum coccineum]|uniref:RNA-directed DNA polymerase, eukaryota, reverse transcriptase zinc-binding domain protein n=1 Tax=Tanacetum coccineum TaxID=301880 RepID=A0ABQ5E9T5_9ASTR